MKKIIKLTESDLHKIVKRVLKEQIPINLPTSISKVQSGDITIGMSQIDATPALSALLVSIGILGITKIFQNVRKEKINELLSDVNKTLESTLNNAELSCVSKELSKLGRVVKLTDNKKLDRVKNSIIHCLGDPTRVDDIVISLDSILKQFKRESSKKGHNKTSRQKGGHV